MDNTGIRGEAGCPGFYPGAGVSTSQSLSDHPRFIPRRCLSNPRSLAATAAGGPLPHSSGSRSSPTFQPTRSWDRENLVMYHGLWLVCLQCGDQPYLQYVALFCDPLWRAIISISASKTESTCCECMLYPFHCQDIIRGGPLLDGLYGQQEETIVNLQWYPFSQTPVPSP